MIDPAKALEAVSDLERDLESIEWLLKAIPLMLTELEREEAMPICTIVWHANDHVEQLWKRRDALLKLLGYKDHIELAAEAG
jgi:hypothetical protein